MAYEDAGPTEARMPDPEAFTPGAYVPPAPLESGQTPAPPAPTSAPPESESGIAGVAHQATHLVREQVADRIEQAAGGVERVANLADQAGETLRQHDQSALAQYASRAADRLEQLATHLRETPPEELLAETEQALKRQPALVLAGSVALGLLAARVFKHASNDTSKQ
jgi:hypothetical protein